jgi:hypothetical protein
MRKRLTDYPLRLAVRGGPIHAATIEGRDGAPAIRTVCGRWFPLQDEVAPEHGTGVSCERCKRAVRAGASPLGVVPRRSTDEH